MERSFLDYAMSVIVARALPDVRDGLKPVHRRILWGMHDLGARPDRPTMKCARVTGEVMGKYHPHGDSAIYDALVRMGQDFSLRHPLVAPQGQLRLARRPARRRPLHRVPPGPARHARCSTASTRTPSTSVDNYAGEFARARRCCPPASPTCWSTAARASPSAWPPTSRPTTWARSSTPPCTCIDNPEADARRPHAVRQGPRLPDRRAHHGPPGDHRRLPHRAGSIRMRGRGRDRGGQAQRPHRRHRAAVPGRAPTRSWPRSRELVDARELEGIADVNDESAGRDPHRHQAQARRARRSSSSTTSTSARRCRPPSPSTRWRWSTACPARSTSRQALEAYIDHQVEVITRRSEFRLRQGPASGPTSSRACSRRST